MAKPPKEVTRWLAAARRPRSSQCRMQKERQEWLSFCILHWFRGQFFVTVPLGISMVIVCGDSAVTS